MFFYLYLAWPERSPLSEDIRRQTCSHDLAFRLRDDVEGLGELMPAEILIGCCLRCSSAVGLTSRTYELKDDPQLYMHRRRGNDGVYQCITVYARKDVFGLKHPEAQE